MSQLARLFPRTAAVKSATWLAKCVCAAFSFLLLSAPAIAQTTYSDSEFVNSDWTLFTETSNGSSAIKSQVNSGGNPDAWMRVENTSNNAIISTYIFSNTAVYSPNTSGAISTLSVTFNHYTFQITPFSSHGQYVGLAIRQNNKSYYGQFDQSYPSSWASISIASMTQDTFRTLSDANDHPDFSTNGSTLSFGLWNYNVDGATRTTGSAFDNFSVTVQNASIVPESGTLALLGFAVLPVGTWLVRRRK